MTDIPAAEDTASTVPPQAFQPKPGAASTATALAKLAESQAAMISALPQIANAVPQMMAQALASVLQQVPVQTRQHVCCPCLLARLNWEAAHEREMKAAIEAAAQFAGIGEQDPRRAQLDPAPFLPDHLQPGAGSQGMPPLTAAATTVGGTDVCPVHIPGRQGGKQLLLASGPLSQGMLASLG